MHTCTCNLRVCANIWDVYASVYVYPKNAPSVTGQSCLLPVSFKLLPSLFFQINVKEFTVSHCLGLLTAHTQITRLQAAGSRGSIFSKTISVRWCVLSYYISVWDVSNHLQSISSTWNLYLWFLSLLYLHPFYPQTMFFSLPNRNPPTVVFIWAMQYKVILLILFHF